MGINTINFSGIEVPSSCKITPTQIRNENSVKIIIRKCFNTRILTNLALWVLRVTEHILLFVIHIYNLIIKFLYIFPSVCQRKFPPLHWKLRYQRRHLSDHVQE